MTSQDQDSEILKSQGDESDSESDPEFSDDAAVVWSDAKNYKIKFGQFKGKPLKNLIKTKKTRDVLKYYLSWDKLRDESRENIECALGHYSTLKQN